MIYSKDHLKAVHDFNLRSAFDYHKLNYSEHYLSFIYLKDLLNQYSYKNSSISFERVIDFCERLSSTAQPSYLDYVKFSDSILFHLSFFPHYFDKHILSKDFYRLFAKNNYGIISEEDDDVFRLLYDHFLSYERALAFVGKQYFN
jgi:hypothetical protein